MTLPFLTRKNPKLLDAHRRRQARKIDGVTKGNTGLSKKNWKGDGRLLFKNTSLWPTLLVNLVIDFVLDEIRSLGGRSGCSEIIVQHTRRGGHGHAYSWRAFISHNRSQPRMNWKYVGIGWARDNATKTALQSLCHLIAHELIHTTDLVKWERVNGRLKRQKLEFRTDNLAAEIVSRFAGSERSIWKKYRKARRTQRNAELRRRKAAKSRKGGGHKLRLTEQGLDRWEAEVEARKKNLDKATRMVRKYRTRLNRMRGARRAAAARRG